MGLSSELPTLCGQLARRSTAKLCHNQVHMTYGSVPYMYCVNFYDPKRDTEFTKISGSKMRKFAREGVTPPDGYMCPTGWEVVANFYKDLARNAEEEAAGQTAKKAKN